MFKKLLKKIANELNTHNIPYMVIGVRRLFSMENQD